MNDHTHDLDQALWTAHLIYDDEAQEIDSWGDFYRLAIVTGAIDPVTRNGVLYWEEAVSGLIYMLAFTMRWARAYGVADPDEAVRDRHDRQTGSSPCDPGSRRLWTQALIDAGDSLAHNLDAQDRDAIAGDLIEIAWLAAKATQWANDQERKKEQA